MIEKRSIEELLEVARLEDVVGQFVTLTGRANLKGDKCPFCGSGKKFTVSKPKQIYKCFECEKGGNGPLKFLMEGRGMKYREAITWLADHYKFILREADGATESSDGFDRSYFNERMEAIGYKADEAKDLFRARTDGGIEIRYPNLYPGETWQQHKGTDFVRTRLHPTKVSSKGKYNQPDSSGIRIFIPPVVVAEHHAGVEWETLYVVEGEFKAFAAARPGVPVVGIGGIQLFIEKKGSHNLHADLVQLLRKAKAVALVHDADATEVKWDPATEPDKDLGKRLRDFARAVTGFRRSVGTLVPDVYYTRIAPTWLPKAKGLDDLCAHEGPERIIERLSANYSDGFFIVRNITKEDWRGINGIFSLNMIGGVPRVFYRSNEALLLEHPFRFCGGRFQYVRDDEDSEGKLEMLEHPDSKMYLAVGCDFYKKLTRLDENKRAQAYLKDWKESNLQRNYVRNGVPRFLHTIETYDDFIVAPGHHEDYRQEVIVQEEEFGPSSRLLNKYRPLDYPAKQGTWPNIEKFLKHVFGTHEIHTKDSTGKILATSEAWIFYVDRWTIMYREPHQRLPAVVLANELRNTGKSTLLWLNLAMWGGNGVVIGNNAITDNFNADWIDCSFVGVDETSIDKKQDGEKLKSVMTAPVTQRRGMYKDREKSINFTKFDLTTNDPDKFLQISDDEMRYMVNIVPQYTEEDPDLLKKMIAEIPALFYDLRHRKIVHPRMGRLWFANSVIDTEARREVAKASRSWCEKEVRAWVEEQFYRYRWPELYFSGQQVRTSVNETNGARFRLGEVTEVLRKKLKTHEDFTWVTVPHPPDKRKGGAQAANEIGTHEKARWYVFRAIDWVSPEIAKEILEEAQAEWATSGNGVMEGEFKLHHPEKWPK